MNLELIKKPLDGEPDFTIDMARCTDRAGCTAAGFCIGSCGVGFAETTIDVDTLSATEAAPDMDAADMLAPILVDEKALFLDFIASAS
jgi:hypothetical protein